MNKVEKFAQFISGFCLFIRTEDGVKKTTFFIIVTYENDIFIILSASNQDKLLIYHVNK